MKKLITILAVCLCCSVFGAKAQSNGPDGSILKDIFKSVVESPTVTLDPMAMQYIDAIYNQVVSGNPRFKMYQTKHDYILLKLDTATGQVWMVQFGMGEKSSRRQIVVDDTSPLDGTEPEINGRFELYPTNNMYNFILIDNFVGTTYQVQWHTESNKRFRKFIHE